MGDNLLADLKQAPWYRGQVVHTATLPPSLAQYDELPLPATLQDHLDRRGISLYRHQAETIKAFRNGHDLVITTPTASGKTLAFNLPVIETLIEDESACALYLYPLKALANDQLVKLRDIDDACGLGLVPSTYDGDTPSGQRRRIKEKARVVLTNAHALHQYLPWHHQWARIFANLRVLVIDEAHHYRGVYGANVAHLLRRFLRILDHYGAHPRVIVSSASIANPTEFARALVGRDAVSIEEGASARGEREVLFWDPAVDPSRSITAQAASLVSFLTSRGLQTICFTRSRVMAERVAQRSRKLGRKHVLAYRAGYLPGERRRLEAGLRDGKIAGIVSTSALESGIDIGGLDAAILVGFPGSLLSAWQQAGRAGRGNTPSLIAYIPHENPLDRYFLRHPERFLGRDRERLVLALDNPRQRAGHLACAAAELPLRDEELTSQDDPLASELACQGLLAKTPRGYVYRGLRRAHEAMSLDDLGGETVRLVCDGKLLETMDTLRARRDAYPGAVLLHRGETYLVERLDLGEGIAEARHEEIDYSTYSLRTSELEILSTNHRCAVNGTNLAAGRVRVTESFAGFKTIHADRTMSVSPLDLPPHTFESDGLWISFGRGIADLEALVLLGAIHGAEHALIAVSPLLVLCDAKDVGGVSTPFHAQTGAPTILLFDDMTDGAGIAEILFESFPKLAARARDLVADCPCEEGCPSCLLSSRCGSQNQPLAKAGAIRVLEHLSRITGMGRVR